MGKPQGLLHTKLPAFCVQVGDGPPSNGSHRVLPPGAQCRAMWRHWNQRATGSGQTEDEKTLRKKMPQGFHQASLQ